MDLYCERLGPGFWAEPFNAVSNGAFLLAALWGWARMNRAAAPRWPLFGLIGLAAAIGVGSFLFHTFATSWASYGDVVPIWLFVGAYLVVAVVRFTRERPSPVVVAIASVAALAIAAYSIVTAGSEGNTGSPDDPLNGSGQYAPALAALILVVAFQAWRRRPSMGWVLAATLTFVVSLVFRTLDRDICEAFPLGTHFLWHLCNGLMVALLLQALIRVEPRPTEALA